MVSQLRIPHPLLLVWNTSSRYWHPYTQAQITQSTIKITTLLQKASSKIANIWNSNDHNDGSSTDNSDSNSDKWVWQGMIAVQSQCWSTYTSSAGATCALLHTAGLKHFQLILIIMTTDRQWCQSKTAACAAFSQQACFTQEFMRHVAFLVCGHNVIRRMLSMTQNRHFLYVAVCCLEALLQTTNAKLLYTCQ